MTVRRMMLVALVALISACIAVSSYDPARDPEADLHHALQRAQASEKRVLVIVGGEWCGWCKVLDRFVKENREVAGLWDGYFVTMHVNFSPENENAAFLKRFPAIDGYPHIFVLEKDGRFLYSQGTGGLESGTSYSPEKMTAFLRSWIHERLSNGGHR